MKRIDFYFDLSSPYSYLAATQLPLVAARTGAEIGWKPVVLSAIFKATGNDMPARVATKARWMGNDLARWAEEYGVPFQFSSRFPVNAIKAMRLILVAARAGRAAEAAQAAYRALWVDDADLSDPSVLAAIARAAGLDPEAALKAIEEQPIKDLLRANTDEAIARGAFGAPTMIVGDQLFWGNDRLHHLERLLTK
jgi:2-hydroxychromene-2-carboxylate isomerase